MIKDEFSTYIVIIVAHRIPIVIDSDMVLALRDGHLIEFDSPKTLIEKRDISIFSVGSRIPGSSWSQ